jgi:putative membrane protein
MRAQADSLPRRGWFHQRFHPGRVIPDHVQTVMLATKREVCMKGLLVRSLLAWIVLAVGFAITDGLMDSFKVEGGIGTLLWVSFLFAVVSALLGPILRLLSLPLTILTLGLFGVVINGALLALTAWLSDDLEVGGIFFTIVAAVVISIVTTVLGFFVMPKDEG